MKFDSVSIAWLALFTGLASAQGYNSACNPAIGEEEIEPGVVATYGCGRINNKPDYANEVKSTASPKDCAVECAKRSPEGPCSWVNNQCWFYKAGAGSGELSNSVTVVVKRDWQKLKEAYDQKDTQLQDCLAGGNGGPPGLDIGGPPGHPTPGACKFCFAIFEYIGSCSYL